MHEPNVDDRQEAAGSEVHPPYRQQDDWREPPMKKTELAENLQDLTGKNLHFFMLDLKPKQKWQNLKC